MKLEISGKGRKAKLEPEGSRRLRITAEETARSRGVLQATTISDKYSELSCINERQHNAS